MKNDEGKKPEADASPIGQARLTRRGFLKTTAGTAALAAVAGTALNLSKGVAEAAQERKLPAKWDEQVDVIVVGSGFAGLAAARRGLRGEGERPRPGKDAHLWRQFDHQRRHVLRVGRQDAHAPAAQSRRGQRRTA
jgi:hypothetical protein